MGRHLVVSPPFPEKNWRPFLDITITFIHFNLVSLIISGMLLCCKKFAAPLVGPFCGGPSSAEHAEHA